MFESHDDESPGKTECLEMLRTILRCLDSIAATESPDYAGKVGIAIAHLQHAVDLLDEAEETVL